MGGGKRKADNAERAAFDAISGEGAGGGVEEVEKLW